MSGLRGQAHQRRNEPPDPASRVHVHVDDDLAANHLLSWPVWEDLTPTETRIVELLAEGLTDTQIAEQLVLSHRTVAIHISRILRKIRRSGIEIVVHGAGFDHVMENGTENRAPVWRPAGQLSVRATGWAARLLPRADRPHYRELFQSELAELAQGPHPRRAQAAYTIRVLLHALPLRRTLRAPTPAARQRIW